MMSADSFGDIPLEEKARKINAVAGCTGCPRITAKQYLERNEYCVDIAVADYYGDESLSSKPSCFDDVGEGSGSPVATLLSSEDDHDKTAGFDPAKEAGPDGSGPTYGGVKPREALVERPPGKTFRRNMVEDSSHISGPSQPSSSDGASGSDDSVSSLGYDRDHHIVAESPVASEWPDWDFKLPSLPEFTAEMPQMMYPKSTRVSDLLSAILSGCATKDILEVLTWFPDRITEWASGCLIGIPTIFWVVASGNIELVKYWIDHGADASAIHSPSGTPLLAFAIVHPAKSEQRKARMVGYLLSLGASPTSVPSEFYSPYCRDLPQDGPAPAMDGDTPSAHAWCMGVAVRRRFAENINLTHRYYLWRASRMKKPSKRASHVAELKKTEELFRVPYFLVEQSIARNRLMARIVTHVAKSTNKPLVLMFAGPSGHGKTELAQQLGIFLDVPMHITDCASIESKMGMFGPRKPYKGYEKGSPLNNFLAENSGRKCVVLLDEFEKTSTEIREMFLLPFDNGKYRDHRNEGPVGCSKVMWVLTTNALDPIITSFCAMHETLLSDEGDFVDKERQAAELTKTLRMACTGIFTPPVSGRISEIIPFLPFNPNEQAVICHKKLLALKDELIEPVKVKDTTSLSTFGDVRLKILQDASICQQIAKENYAPDLGARSLHCGIDGVREIIFEKYLELDEPIEEGRAVEDIVVDIQAEEIVVSRAIM